MHMKRKLYGKGDDVMGKIKRGVIYILSVVGAVIIAILVHALLPSPGASLDTGEFDGALVQAFGFPVVASAYFIILYLHILLVIKCFLQKSTLSNKETGIRYGFSFGLMYLVGMQEVVVSASPFDTYGLDFVTYQFFMGLGDTIPVLILCLLVCGIGRKKLAGENKTVKYTTKENVIASVVITITFFTERTIGYMAGYLDSDISEYPVPVVAWTAIFGFALSVMYLVIRPIYNNKNNVKRTIQIVVLSIGVNWIWFNCFMGLILDGLFAKMFLRSAIDVICTTVACLVFAWIKMLKENPLNGLESKV